MRWTAFVLLLCSATLLTSCEDTYFVIQTGKFAASGTVVVWIQWDGQGLPDKRVELVELNQVMTTNEEGLAEFVVPVGDYTVRAYDINRGGPMMMFLDSKVTVDAEQEARVEVVDCLPCV